MTFTNFADDDGSLAGNLHLDGSWQVVIGTKWKTVSFLVGIAEKCHGHFVGFAWLNSFAGENYVGSEKLKLFHFLCVCVLTLFFGDGKMIKSLESRSPKSKG